MSPEDYRRHAADCLGIAESIINPQHRARLVIIAHAWLQLARRAEKIQPLKSSWKRLPSRTVPHLDQRIRRILALLKLHRVTTDQG